MIVQVPQLGIGPRALFILDRYSTNLAMLSGLSSVFARSGKVWTHSPWVGDEEGIGDLDGDLDNGGMRDMKYHRGLLFLRERGRNSRWCIKKTFKKLLIWWERSNNKA